MIIEKLALRNFGLYKGYQQIDLTPHRPEKPIILVGGLNGGGKTTFLDAIQLSLYGRRARCSNRGSLSYDEYLKRSINYHVDGEQGASVEIQITQHAVGEEKTYRINRSWYVRKEKLTEKVSVSVNGSHDRLLSENWNETVDEIFPASLSHLFFFDGEKIEEFADLENSRQSVGKAISALLGLDLVERLKSDLAVYDSRQKINLGTVADRKRIDSLKEECERIEEARLEYVSKRAEKQTKEIDRLERELHWLLEKYKSEGGDLIGSKQSLGDDRDDLKRELQTIKAKLFELAAGAAPLTLVRSLIEKTHAQSKQEELSKENRILRSVLAKRDKDLINVLRKKQPDINLLDIVKEFLQTDRKERDASLVADSYVELSESAIRHLDSLNDGHLFSDIAKPVKGLSRQFHLRQERILDIDRKLASIPDAERLGGLSEEIDKVRSNLENSRIDVSALELEIGRLARERQLKERLLQREIEEVFGSELDRDDVDRSLLHSKKVREAIEKFREILLQKQLKQIESLVLDSYRQLLRKTTLIEALCINSSDFSLELRNAEDQVVPAERLSAGERQLLAVALLWGLARFSERPLPIIIDTPLGRLDASHRQNLIERYFPHASHQVILLSTDQEIDLGLYEQMKPSIGRSYTLDYDDEMGVATIRGGYFGKDDDLASGVERDSLFVTKGAL
ncbi:MAG: DNA sulfur modification protein DndD [Pyrinomonadaceae bacterium]